MDYGSFYEARDEIEAMCELFRLMTNDQFRTFAGENPTFVAFSESSNSGTWNGVLAAGESRTMSMSVAASGLLSSSNATLKLTDFTLIPADGSFNVGVDFNSGLGSVTANGTSIAAGTTLEGVSSAEGSTTYTCGKCGRSYVETTLPPVIPPVQPSPKIPWRQPVPRTAKLPAQSAAAVTMWKPAAA